MENDTFGQARTLLGEQKSFDLFQSVSGVLQVPNLYNSSIYRATLVQSALSLNGNNLADLGSREEWGHPEVRLDCPNAEVCPPRSSAKPMNWELLRDGCRLRTVAVQVN